MTFLVTLTLHFVFLLEMSGCPDHLADILATVKMKDCNLSIFEAMTFYIGFNGHVPDEYFPDDIKKNRLYLNHSISIIWWCAKLHYCLSSRFRAICNKPVHKIMQRTAEVWEKSTKSMNPDFGIGPHQRVILTVYTYSM